MGQASRHIPWRNERRPVIAWPGSWRGPVRTGGPSRLRRAAAGERRLAWPARWLIAMALLAISLWVAVGPFEVRPALVTGTSMQPNLWMGDIVVTRQIPPGDIRPGDVVRYRSERISILHRVIEVRHQTERYSFITQGDNNEVPDYPVDEGQIEGKLVLQVPRLGWLALSARHHLEPSH